MAKRIHINDYYSLKEWQKLIKKNQNLDVRFRMLIIERVLANPKISSKEICAQFYISIPTFFRWLKWYNEGGLKKLIMGDGGKGSKSSDKKIYGDEVFEALKEEIDHRQDTVWTLEKMRYFLKEKFDIEPTIQAIRYRIKDTHSYKSSRPYPHKADRDKLGRFKKTE
jgi:transposase